MAFFSIITLVSVLLYGILLIFYIEQWQSIPEFNSTKIKRETTVSIIIPARNESAHILTCLDAVLHQNYPTNLYEVVVIDDFSEDDTFALVNSISKHNLKVFQLSTLLANEQELITSYKKKAIEKAIDQCNSELIVCIDADVVMDEKWLRTVVAFYEQQQCLMIAAPVMFHRRNNFMSRFQILDFCGMMLTTGAVIESQNGLMCNGANLAFKRKAFHYVNGYNEVDQYGSGDDVFLMYKINHAFPGACRFLKSKTATVYTEAQANLFDFLQQRLRWASKNKNFKDRKINIQLIIILLANLLLLIYLLLVFFHCYSPIFNSSMYLYFFLIALVIKCIADFKYLYSGASFFKQTALLWWFIPAQFTHIIYISLVGVLGNFISYRWKGRKYSQ